MLQVGAEVPEDQLPSAVYEGSGELAAGTGAVRVGVEVGGQVPRVVLQLLGGVQGSASMVQVRDTCMWRCAGDITSCMQCMQCSAEDRSGTNR